MSVWSEPEGVKSQQLPAQVVDVVLRIECESLPVDHAAALNRAVVSKVSWIAGLDNVGIHSLHVAGSQNGWERPDESSGELLYPSRRTRLKIRIHNHDAQRLIDELQHCSLNLDGHKLHVVSGVIRPLLASPNIFSRHTCFSSDREIANSEAFFESAVIKECQVLGYTPTKILCGKTHLLQTGTELIMTRSVLLADVPTEYSMLLQENGLGLFRNLGCGLMLPHKGTNPV